MPHSIHKKFFSRRFFKINPLHHAMLLCLTVTPVVTLGMTPDVNAKAKTHAYQQPHHTKKAANTKTLAKRKPPKKPSNKIPENPITQWTPRVTLNAQVGSYTFGQGDLMLPLVGRMDRFAYLDLRAAAVTDDTQEYNAGLGYRGLLSNVKYPFILGGYVWADRRRSSYGEFFDQVTAGLEYLGWAYDVRANFYAPVGTHSARVVNTYDPFAAGFTVGYDHNQTFLNALNGFDIEAGKVDLFDHKLRVYGDYYHFGIGSDPKRMNGGRARLEYILENQWLDSYGTNIIFTASYQYDNIRNSMAFAGLRLNLGNDYKPTRSLVGRMEDLVIRDDNIVLVKTYSSKRYTDPQRFLFVDNGAPLGGDGSLEHPFQQELTALNASVPGDAIYTFPGIAPYSVPVGGLNLKLNQLFYGSGVNVRYNNVIVLPATTAPIINGTLNIQNGNLLTGFTVSGAGLPLTETKGIFGDGLSNVTISYVTVRDFDGGHSADGANASTTTGSATGGNGATGTTMHGIVLTNSLNSKIIGVTVQDITGGSANGGDAFATGTTSSDNESRAGNGNRVGESYGIFIGDINVTASSITVTDTHGGGGSNRRQ